MQVNIGGEPRTLGGFSAYKAFKAMDIIAAAQGIYQQVLSASADFKRRYETENVVVIPRSEARRQFAPTPLVRTVREETDDGRPVVRHEPVLDDAGLPVLGPDPLAHLTDADWEASDNVLTIGDSPSEGMQFAAMVPKAFELGREQVLSLLAIALVANADLEKWDADGDVDAELDRVAKSLQHDASADELVTLAVAVIGLCREQIAGPFDQLVTALRTTFRPLATASEAATEATTETGPDGSGRPAPMRVETEPSPPSSTESPDGTDGPPTSSSTEPDSDSSPSFASG